MVDSLCDRNRDSFVSPVIAVADMDLTSLIEFTPKSRLRSLLYWLTSSSSIAGIRFTIMPIYKSKHVSEPRESADNRKFASRRRARRLFTQRSIFTCTVGTEEERVRASHFPRGDFTRTRETLSLYSLNFFERNSTRTEQGE